MLDQVRQASGEHYDQDGYLAQFYKDCAGIDLLWKFERAQAFREPGFPSWDEFEAGDIDGALRLIKEMQPDIEKTVRAKQFATKRVRVVEQPFTPYLWWEFHLLKIRTEAGDNMVVVDSSAIADLETTSQLPEIVGLGDSVLWHTLYNADGIADGAFRITDSELVQTCRREFEVLHKHGEPLLQYYDRVVRCMSAPTAA